VFTLRREALARIMMAITFFTLLAVYPVGILLVTNAPQRRLWPSVPWGRGRSVAVHPSRMDALRVPGVPAGYRRWSQGTVVGHELRTVVACVEGPALGEFGGTAVLEALAERRALLVTRSWLGVVHHRAVFVAHVTDDGGAARVRARVVVRGTPCLVVAFFGFLSVHDLHGIAMVLGVPLLAGACLSLLRLRRCIRWAHEEIARTLAQPAGPRNAGAITRRSKAAVSAAGQRDA
jgi:hypothetical protein